MQLLAAGPHQALIRPQPSTFCAGHLLSCMLLLPDVCVAAAQRSIVERAFANVTTTLMAEFSVEEKFAARAVEL